MANRGLVKSYSAEGAISPCRFVKPGAADYGVLQAAAAADKVIGITVPLITVAATETVDVVHEGITDLELGGVVARGDLLISDANGKGIVATAGAGANVRTGAIAMVSGVAGDVIPVLVEAGSFQG